MFEKIIRENEDQKIVELPSGSIKIIEKKRSDTSVRKKEIKDPSWRWLGCSKNRWFEMWKDKGKSLPPTQRSIMVSLWLYAGNRGHCYPSERTLAKKLGVSLSTIWINIKILKKKRYFKIEKTKGKYNRYILLK